MELIIVAGIFLYTSWVDEVFIPLAICYILFLYA